MRDDSEAIIKTFSQIKKIYEQVSLLLTTADDMMAQEQWATDISTVLYDTAITLHNYDKWLPSIIRRTYINDKYKDLRRYIAVRIDDDTVDFEPLVIGTTLQGLFENTLEFRSWDAYWWWKEKGDGVIKEPKVVYSSEDRELSEIHSFACPLVDITDSEKLRECIIAPLLKYTGSGTS